MSSFWVGGYRSWVLAVFLITVFFTVLFSLFSVSIGGLGWFLSCTVKLGHTQVAAFSLSCVTQILSAGRELVFYFPTRKRPGFTRNRQDCWKE